MKTIDKYIMVQRIKKHGQNLKTVFNLDSETDPIKLCKRLFRLETKAHKLAEDFCNGVIDQLEWDTKAGQILTKAEIIFQNKANGFIFVNGDARGYSLKILEEFTTYLRNRSNVNIHRDWGGYGIIAPDFREFK